MKLNRKRLLLSVLSWVAIVGGLACAEGVRSEPETVIEPPPPVVEPPCGNGKPDPGEECECPNKMTTGSCALTNTNVTCASIGMGFTGGTLLCNAAPRCTFNTMLCTGGPPSGGTGGSGR